MSKAIAIPLELVDVALQEGEGGQDEVGVGDGVEQLAALGSVQDKDVEGGSELGGLGFPIRDDGSGSDDEGGLASYDLTRNAIP